MVFPLFKILSYLEEKNSYDCGFQSVIAKLPVFFFHIWRVLFKMKPYFSEIFYLRYLWYFPFMWHSHEFPFIRRAELLGQIGMCVPGGYVWCWRRPRGRINLLHKAPLPRALRTLNVMAGHYCALRELTRIAFWYTVIRIIRLI